MTQQADIALFSYGSLRQSEVQLAKFGRRLEGRADVLTGYRCETIRTSTTARSGWIRRTASRASFCS